MAKILIVIPTRNRSAFAIAAAKSASSQPAVHRIVVSDNSDVQDPSFDAAIRAVEGAVLIRPAHPLAMSEHWEWAVSTALSLETAASHISILPDRSVFKPGSFHWLERVVRDWPDDIVAYNSDALDDWRNDQVRILRAPGSGELYRLATSKVAECVAQGMHHLWTVPRFLNCIVPLRVVDRLRRSGPLFHSVSPDYFFGFRVLAALETFLVIDIALAVSSGSVLSNGLALARGHETPTTIDFMRSRKEGCQWNTPFPSIDLPANIIFHEYETVRSTNEGRALPALASTKVKEALAIAALSIANVELREQVFRELGIAPSMRDGRNSTSRRLGRMLTQPHLYLSKMIKYNALPPWVRRYSGRFPAIRFANAHDAMGVASSAFVTRRAASSAVRASDGQLVE